MVAFPLTAIHIIESTHCAGPEREQVVYPKRTSSRRWMKKYAKNARNWRLKPWDHAITMDGGRTLVCHPATAEKLRVAITNQGTRT